MTPSEAVHLLAEARALFGAMEPVEGQGALWHQVLGELTYQDAKDALIAYAREASRVVTVADILEYAKTQRAAALEEHERTLLRLEPARTDPPAVWFQIREEFTRRQESARARKRAEEQQRQAAAEQHKAKTLTDLEQAIAQQATGWPG